MENSVLNRRQKLQEKTIVADPPVDMLFACAYIAHRHFRCFIAVGLDLYDLIRWVIFDTAVLAILANGLWLAAGKGDWTSFWMVEIAWGLIAWSAYRAEARGWPIWWMTLVAFLAFLYTEPSHWTSTVMFSPISAIFCWLTMGWVRLRLQNQQRFDSV